MAQVKIDYDRLAREYAQHRQVHPAVLQALCETISPPCNVLEVGCGTGNYIIAIAALVGCPCWGIDPSAEMLAQARDAWGYYGQDSQLDLRMGQAERTGIDGVQFDLIFTVDVIHHVSDRPAHMAEVHRLLRPGGRACTVTDSEWIIRHRQPLATYFPETVEIELARYPKVDALCDMMARAGLGEIEVRTVEHAYELADVQAYRDRAFSILHLIPEDAFRRGVARMERDLRHGPIPCVSRYALVWGRRSER
jgi:ubiquinone/menaquinone biosynthesis C-methylase UbiE